MILHFSPSVSAKGASRSVNFSVTIQTTIESLGTKQNKTKQERERERKMGQKVPVPDDRMQKMIDKLRLSKKEQARMWARFRKYDKDKSGTMDISEFYQMIGEKQSIFGDSIFELIGKSVTTEAVRKIRF